MTKDCILLGKVITSIWLAADRGAIKFDLSTGESIIARADGDCCSHTWIENVEGAGDVLNDPVLVAEDVNMPDQEYDKEEYECLAFYGFRVRTSKGEMLLDYRNESNGYYGGDLCWPGENFYGGVHGQNVSREEWEKIA